MENAEIKTPSGAFKSTLGREAAHKTTDIVSLGAAAQQKWLSRFAHEVHKNDGSPYHSESLFLLHRLPGNTVG